MTEKNIDQALNELRTHIDQLAASNTATREKLQSLLSDLEENFHSLEGSEHHVHLVGDLKEAISEFEVEHPRLTGILNDIMVALSNLGI
jgi:chromosome segregation ATPase